MRGGTKLKRIFIIFMILTVLAGYVIPVNADDIVPGWTVNFGNTESDVIVDSTVAHSGKRSLKLIKTSPEIPNVYLCVQTSINVEKGADYEYGFYAKASKANNQSVRIDW